MTIELVKEEDMATSKKCNGKSCSIRRLNDPVKSYKAYTTGKQDPTTKEKARARERHYLA